VFNNLPSSFLPIGHDDTPIDFGLLAVMNAAVVSNIEDLFLCQIDNDQDGEPLCVDDDELDDSLENVDDQELEEDELVDEESCLADHKVLICHFPPGNPENAQTICVDQNSLKFSGHLRHTDMVGACYGEDEGDNGDIGDDDDETSVDNPISCSHPIRIRFDYIKTQNWDDGDLRPFTYVGEETDPYWPWESIGLLDESGNSLVDAETDGDVPGVALQRGPGWIHFQLIGNHKPFDGKEALNGKITFDGAHIVEVVNDKRGRFERQGDGYAVFGQAKQDEYTVVNPQTLNVISTVTVHSDGFTVYYQGDDCE